MHLSMLCRKWVAVQPNILVIFGRTVEDFFANFEVPTRVQARLLIPALTECSKTLLARLPRESHDDFTNVRDYSGLHLKIIAINFGVL